MRTLFLTVLSIFLLVILYPLYTQADEITQMCQSKWSSNYEMVLYCIKNQRNAKREISGYYGMIRNNCKKKWGSNYEMVLYCIKNQSAAKREIDGIKSIPRSYVPSYSGTDYYKTVPKSSVNKINKLDIPKIEKLISRYGKPFIIDLILDKRNNYITLRVDSELRDFGGPPGEEYVTPETILIDLGNIGLTLTGFEELLQQRVFK